MLAIFQNNFEEKWGSSISVYSVTDIVVIYVCWFFFSPPSLCIFCGERDESFTDEGLDLHYWKHCPMLTRCEHCRQVRHKLSRATMGH